MNDGEENIQLPLALSNLTTLVEERIENFATGDKVLQDAALNATKFIFDLTLKSEPVSRPYLQELLDQIDPAQAPQTRSQARSLAESGSTRPKTVSHALLKPTPLSSLFVDGMDEDQIWAQLDLKAKNVCDTLIEAFDAGDVDARGMRDLPGDDDDDDDDDDSGDEGVSDSEEELSDDIDNMEEDEDMSITSAFANGQWNLDTGEDDDEEDDEEKEEGDEGDIQDEENGRETFEELRDPSEEEESEDDDEGDESVMDLDAPSSSKRPLSRKTSKSKHPELDDDFFNLADFNAEIMEAESKSVSRGALSKDSDDEDSDDDGIDLFAAVDNVEAFEEDDMEEEAGEAYYKDFFEAPPKPSKKRKAESPMPLSKNSKVRFHEEVKVKTIKSRGKGLKLSEVDRLMQKSEDDDDEEYEPDDSSDSEGEDEAISNAVDDYEDLGSEGDSDVLESGREAIERLKDDLFADDDEDVQKSDMSTYEARMTALREQIAALEAENVGEKDWVLKGEVTSRARPQNGLLEEDLEFERVMKPVPVVSDEVVRDLEARIKARIIEGRFDDVERKRAVDDKPFLPSRIIELQDTKSKESLAQIYENEFVAAQTGGTTDDRDGKLRKEHEEIEKLWEGICYKLDALCNAHFTPKQPKATISTVTNASAISLESALPTSKATSTILAPEEVFASNPTDLRAKSELTPAEKQALRAKERRKKKKQRDVLERNVDKFAKANGMRGVKKQKEAALKSVVKSGKGVTVIGKKSQELKKGKRPNQS